MASFIEGWSGGSCPAATIETKSLSSMPATAPAQAVRAFRMPATTLQLQETPTHRLRRPTAQRRPAIPAHIRQRQWILLCTSTLTESIESTQQRRRLARSNEEAGQASTAGETRDRRG
eukprot:3841437-Rhodomonas_salina.3